MLGGWGRLHVKFASQFHVRNIGPRPHTSRAVKTYGTASVSERLTCSRMDVWERRGKREHVPERLTSSRMDVWEKRGKREHVAVARRRHWHLRRGKSRTLLYLVYIQPLTSFHLN